MWHEARQQEKLVRKVIVDYRRRAERRHEYYDKIKQDPTKFMQIHGKKLRLIIDENSSTDNSSHMVPWQGDKSNMIDRFDVRAHLDFIRETPSSHLKQKVDKEEAKINYERYRILVYNKHKNISESQHLQKIHINETYPEVSIQKQEAEAKKQLLASSKASIGFDYGNDADSSSGMQDVFGEEGFFVADLIKKGTEALTGSFLLADSDESLDDEDFLSELEDIPPLRELTPAALQDLEKCSLNYGMGYNDFIRAMDLDQNIQEQADAAKAIESEKLKMAGKKSRRERRVLKDQRLKNRIIGPLSYVQRQESDNDSETESESSASDDEKNQEGEIEFITSFGDDNDTQENSCKLQITPTPNARASKTAAKKSRRTRSRSRSRRSRSRDRHRRSRSRSRGYGRSYRDSYNHHKRSSSRHRSRSRSRDPCRRPREKRPSPYDGRRADVRDSYKSRDRRSRSRSRGRRSLSHERSCEKPSIPTAKLASTSSKLSSEGSAKKLTPQEKLKIKMQRALKKQLKADKVAMADKRAQLFNEQMEREEQLREMARKMRRRDEGRYDRYDR